MMKKILKRVLMLVIVITIIISTPLAAYFNIENNAYANVGVVGNEFLKQSFVPLLISSGLVFKSKEVIDDVWQKLNDYWVENDTYMKYWQHGPEDPKPDLKTVLFSVISTNIAWNFVKENFVADVKFTQELWEDIKFWVHENYDVGENDLGLVYKSIDSDLYYLDTSNVVYNDDLLKHEFLSVSVPENSLYLGLYYFNKYGDGEFYDERISLTDSDGLITFYSSKIAGWPNIDVKRYEEINVSVNGGINFNSFLLNEYNSNVLKGQKAYGFYYFHNDNNVFTEEEILSRIVIDSRKVIGVSDIVDNSDYDWNNNQTGTKIIPIPIKSDISGNPKVDENGMYIPSIDIEEWVDVQPEEIPLLDPSGVPYEDLPEVPLPDETDDKDTGIFIVIGNFLKNIAENVTGIRRNTATIADKMPDTSTDGTGGIGDGIGDVPTGFEWGDFRHLLDIFFIFIYFIVILILILLKFLQVVFTGLPAISANADLFVQYPTILAGVNYVKNLQVGGLSITVQQAFEYIFLIFFYIFIIKQIRKLYNSHVFEESAENKRNTEDMKLDYYDKKKDNYENSKHYELTNSWKGIEHSHNVKTNSYKDDDYENIKFTGWSDDK